MVYKGHRFAQQASHDAISRNDAQRTPMEGLGLAGGVTRRVKIIFLKKLDWVVQAPFRWHHAALNMVIDLGRAHLVANCDEVLHHLRESWRMKQWTLFTQQNRRDSQTLRHEEYDATRCRVARRRAALGNVHEVACLTGAFVSPMRYSVMTRGRSNGRCPFCHHPVGSKEHVVWNCPARYLVPNRPDNLLEFELGWPLSWSQTQVVQHMAKVRAEVLDFRWRATERGGGLDRLGCVSNGCGAAALCGAGACSQSLFDDEQAGVG